MRLLLLLAVAVATDLRGVKPEHVADYDPVVLTNANGVEQVAWRCLGNPEIVLSVDQINDGHCDCPDGSDEPGTAACEAEYRPFYCANEGHFPGYLNHFKVDDGVCDYDVCCDGLDEASCPNVCEQVHQQYQEYVEEQRANVAKGLEGRLAAVQEAHRLERRAHDTVAGHRARIGALEAQVDEVSRLGKVPVNAVQKVLAGFKQAVLGQAAVEPSVVDHLAELRKQLDETRKELAIAEEQLEGDFGEDGVFRSQQGRRIMGSYGEYSYKIKLLGSVHQENTLVGQYDHREGNRFFYTRGSKCWNGPQRSATVDLVCGAEHRILAVLEPEKCSYAITLSSPLVCEELSEEDLKKGFRVDYQKLSSQ